MNNNPLVTILTNTKNRAGLISRCIESIQKQTYQNYEHIIADGGTDNTEEVVKSYNDPKIKYIKVSEGGPVAQTRVSFGLSKGEFITFLDDDDEYLPEKIEKQLELIQSLPQDYGFIYGSMTYFDYQTGKQLYTHEASYSGGNLLPIAVSYPIICGTPTLMFRREVFESIGGTWIAGIGNEASDWALCCKAIKQGWKVGALKESYLKIYVNHGSVRMSDLGYDQDTAIRYKKFYQYFLDEYADIIKIYPKAGSEHYAGMLANTMKLHEYGDSFYWWKKLLHSRLSIKSILSLPYYWYKCVLK
ncbi:MAG: glycosyltransferase [Prevotella sp.]|nr:glycosyltransferase [Candidatus Equicola stercoris]